MHRFIIFIFFSGLLYLGLSQTGPAPAKASLLSVYKSADQVYLKAEDWAVRSEKDDAFADKADQEYRRALGLFMRLLPDAQKTGYDSLLFFIRLKSGLIAHYFDSLELAKSLYLGSLSLRGKLALADSLYFKPWLFSGSILYRQNQLDSAIGNLREAEILNNRYGGKLDGSERLFNLLGVIYYETGNFRQAINYFQKALDLLSERNPTEQSLRANYQINIGSTLLKLEEYKEAKKIFENVLETGIFSNELYHKLALIHLRENDYAGSVDLLKKVAYPNSRKEIDLYLNNAEAFDGLDQPDSAEHYLHLALAENLKWNGRRKNISYGLILKFQADRQAKKGQYAEALPFYQQALQQFDNAFDDQDFHSNPTGFSGVYSYINLFKTLTDKGETLEKWYAQDNRTATLESALSAYRSAFSLADHVERFYNSDEARLFLGRIKHAAHSRPIDIGLKLFKLTGKKEYLEEVYLLDQRNKASVLALNIRLQELASGIGPRNEIFRKETEIRTSITRFSLKAAVITDSTEEALIKSQIRDLEIELDKIREEIKSDPRHRELLSQEMIPSVNQLHRILDNYTAILSFHMAEEKILVMIITANRFNYYEVPLTQKFLREVESLQNALHQDQPGYRYAGKEQAAWLYKELMGPAMTSLAQSKRLIIIPDDELHYLPFEALEDENGNYLVKKFAIQYQYSTALLGNKATVSPTTPILSFAPFAGSGYRDSAVSLGQLPASAEEVQSMNGKILLDSAATKSNFLKWANRYRVIHLATHANADNQDPQLSYINFYPGTPASRLYAPEIYDLQLDTASLVILSACETGTGQLIKGEGLMSLSRAFAYAGCPNIIMSLWKTEDRVTAFITQRLYFYLEKNETTDRALQLAKTDLMNNPDFDPSLKTPNFWAPLVLIGEYQPNHKRSNWPWVAGGIVTILLGYYFMKKRKPAAGSPAAG
ncbi:MAG: CHAT domain-containing protein [Chitinophagaceae bacterium]